MHPDVKIYPRSFQLHSPLQQNLTTKPWGIYKHTPYSNRKFTSCLPFGRQTVPEKSQHREVSLNRNSTLNHHVFESTTFFWQHSCDFSSQKGDLSILHGWEIGAACSRHQFRRSLPSWVCAEKEQLDICSFVWLPGRSEIFFWILTIVNKYCFPCSCFQLLRHNWRAGITLKGNAFGEQGFLQMSAGYRSSHKSTCYGTIPYQAEARRVHCDPKGYTEMCYFESQVSTPLIQLRC